MVNAPPGYLDLLDDTPLPTLPVDAEGGGRDLDFVQVFTRDAGELERLAPSAIAAVKPDGLLWVCYPKGGAKAGTDLNRDVLWKLMEDRGLVGVTLVAIDDKWSAMRFRPPDMVGA